MEESKISVISIVGPTASGKSSLGIEIAKLFNGEIVSCDSMQIYKDMDIATAKPSQDELATIPHHMIGIVSPEQKYNVADYCQQSKNIINTIQSKNKTPIIVGGTGLYYESLVNGIKFSESETDENYRNELKEIAAKKGSEYLWNQLNAIDNVSASKIHKNDSKRIIRALEIFHNTGETKAEADIKSTLEPTDINSFTICLDVRNRDFLYERINKRVDDMVEMGLVNEAKQFFNADYSSTAVQAIGYKELKPYIEGTDSLLNCLDKLKKSTRNYAKRQLSWFHRYKDIEYIYIDDYENINDMVTDVCCRIERNGYAKR